ncbi:MbeD family mobilization/exclusion protein [Klebsiella michiganensis]
MTELEKQLLSALEQLQQDYSKRLDEWENAFAEWRTMSGLMQRAAARWKPMRFAPCKSTL